jgi:hypothetical protein
VEAVAGDEYRLVGGEEQAAWAMSLGVATRPGGLASPLPAIFYYEREPEYGPMWRRLCSIAKMWL